MFGRQPEKPTVSIAERQTIMEGHLTRLRDKITMTEAAIKEARGIVVALSGPERTAFGKELDGICLALDGIRDKYDNFKHTL